MATFRAISESNVRQLGPLSAGPVRPSGPCCLGVAEAPFLSLESSKTATFLVGSESNVRPLGPLPAGPVRPLGPCCLGVAEAPFLSLESWKMATFLVFYPGRRKGERARERDLLDQTPPESSNLCTWWPSHGFNSGSTSHQLVLVLFSFLWG